VQTIRVVVVGTIRTRKVLTHKLSIMNLKKYEQNLTSPLRQATITLLLRENEVLLAMKKRGFGIGKWNGVGGKPNPGEDIIACAIRESEEEIGVTPIDPKKVAVFNFYFPLVPAEKNWGQQVSVFTATKWQGIPIETEEMNPKWFKLKDVPFKEMWWDDEIWMPKVFAGALLRGSFMFGKDEKLDDYYINEVLSFG